jgi:hypothetical protein
LQNVGDPFSAVDRIRRLNGRFGGAAPLRWKTMLGASRSVFIRSTLRDRQPPALGDRHDREREVAAPPSVDRGANIRLGQANELSPDRAIRRKFRLSAGVIERRRKRSASRN